MDEKILAMDAAVREAMPGIAVYLVLGIYSDGSTLAFSNKDESVLNAVLAEVGELNAVLAEVGEMQNK